MKNSLRFAFVALAVFSASFSALGEETGESVQSLGTWVTSSWTGGGYCCREKYSPRQDA